MYASYKYCTVFVVTYDARCVTLERCDSRHVCTTLYKKTYPRETIVAYQLFHLGPEVVYNPTV